MPLSLDQIKEMIREIDKMLERARKLRDELDQRLAAADWRRSQRPERRKKPRS